LGDRFPPNHDSSSAAIRNTCGSIAEVGGASSTCAHLFGHFQPSFSGLARFVPECFNMTSSALRISTFWSSSLRGLKTTIARMLG